MSFKLRIRGRDYSELAPAANPANPLTQNEQEAEKGIVAANDSTVCDLTQLTISRLAGLAGQAIKRAKPYPRLSHTDRHKASEYHQHHFGCKTCCAAGQGRGKRCEMGQAFWIAYQGENQT